MLHAVLINGSFQDSVTLMLVSRDLSALPQVNRVSVMMGTPANKDVFRETGMWHAALAAATPNDLCIVVDSENGDPQVAGAMAEQVKSRLAELAHELDERRRHRLGADCRAFLSPRLHPEPARRSRRTLVCPFRRSPDRSWLNGGP